MEVKRRGLNLERWLPQLRQIKIDRVIGRRTDRGWNSGKYGQSGAVNVTCRNQLHTRMAPDDRRKFGGIQEVLPIHMPNAGLERRMMQEQQRRPLL